MTPTLLFPVTNVIFEFKWRKHHLMYVFDRKPIVVFLPRNLNLYLSCNSTNFSNPENLYECIPAKRLFPHSPVVIVFLKHTKILLFSHKPKCNSIMQAFVFPKICNVFPQSFVFLQAYCIPALLL